MRNIARNLPETSEDSHTVEHDTNLRLKRLNQREVSPTPIGGFTGVDEHIGSVPGRKNRPEIIKEFYAVDRKIAVLVAELRPSSCDCMANYEEILVRPQ